MEQRNFRIRPGDTFFNLLDPLLNLPKPHLWIVLNDPAGSGRAAMANITTHNAETRHRCSAQCLIVRHGEHPFVEAGHASCVRYAEVLYPLATIRHAVEHPGTERREPLSPALLRRVRQDALDSDRVARAIKDAVRAALGQRAP